MGESIPVNQKLSDIFLQLHISERTGRGIPKITNVYGKDAFEFRDNSIIVKISFNIINKYVGENIGNKVGYKKELSKTRERILLEMRNNPNITQAQLAIIIGISNTSIENNISFLKKNGYIKRIGSNKTGYWEVE